MPFDKTGAKLKPGDVVGVLYEITNVIAGASGTDLLCKHVTPPYGSPDDLRVALESSKVELVRSAAEPVEAKPVGAAEAVTG